jgi:hypothetical protein
MLRILLACVVCIGLAACARTTVQPDVAPPQLWDVRVDVASTLVRADGAALPDALAPLASAEESRAFSVRGDRALLHPDGSHSTRLRFLGESDPLHGRVVDLRHFDSGEILALDWLEHAAGPGPGLDVLSPIFALISPKVPLLRRGRPGQMITAWPVEVGPDRKVTERIRTTWTHAGSARVLGRPTVALRYEGDWETGGEDAGHKPAVTVEARGTVAGSLWLDVRDMSVVAHDFTWERRVVAVYPSAPGGELELVQRQSLSGRVERREVLP